MSKVGEFPHDFQVPHKPLGTDLWEIQGNTGPPEWQEDKISNSGKIYWREKNATKNLGRGTAFYTVMVRMKRTSIMERTPQVAWSTAKSIGKVSDDPTWRLVRKLHHDGLLVEQL